MAVLLNRLGLVGHLAVGLLPRSPTDTTAPPPTPTPTARTLLELLTLAALIPRLPFRFGASAANGFNALCRRRPFQAVLVAACASVRASFRATVRTPLSAPTPAAAALRTFLLAVALRFCELFGVFLLFQEVCYVKKGVAFQPQVDERRLHAGKHARHFAFVNGSGERVLILPLVIDFGELLVFNDRKPRFVRRG